MDRKKLFTQKNTCRQDFRIDICFEGTFLSNNAEIVFKNKQYYYRYVPEQSLTEISAKDFNASSQHLQTMPQKELCLTFPLKNLAISMHEHHHSEVEDLIFAQLVTVNPKPSTDKPKIELNISFYDCMMGSLIGNDGKFILQEFFGLCGPRFYHFYVCEDGEFFEEISVEDYLEGINDWKALVGKNNTDFKQYFESIEFVEIVTLPKENIKVTFGSSYYQA